MLNTNLLRSTRICNEIYGIQMHYYAIIKFGIVIKVDEKLNWFNISIKISDVNISNFSNNPIEAIIEKSFNKKLMIHSYHFWHYMNSRFSNNFLFGYVQKLTGWLITIYKFPYRSILNTSILH